LKRLTTRRAGALLFAVALFVYAFPAIYNLVHKPFFTLSTGQDQASTNLLPVSLLQRGDFYLDEYRDFYTRYWRDPYFVATVNGRLVSRSPVAAAVIAAPLYGAPLGTGWLWRPGRAELEFPWSAFLIAKIAAAVITALAALMFFFCARQLTDLRASIALTCIFAFATSVWSTASQGLWQQTPSILFQLIGIWFLLRGIARGAAAVAPGAFFFSLATIARPNDGLTALLFTLYVFLYHRAVILKWLAWAMPPAIFFFAYNTIYNGSPLVFGYQDGVATYLSFPKPDALVGLFIAPSRGLFIFSPFLILSAYGAWLAHNDRAAQFYRFAGAAIVVGVILLAMWENWDGGWGYGTRMLTDLLPYFTLLLIPVYRGLRGIARVAFAGSAIYAAILQSFGLWDYGVRWHWSWDNNYAYDVWNLARNAPLFYLNEYSTMAQYYLNIYLFR